MGTAKDDLISILADELNSNSAIQTKDRVAFFLDGSDECSVEVVDWLSTGSSMLDLAISNRPHGGMPVGRIVEIIGLEGTGKSLLAAHILASVQRKGGIAIFIDVESAVSRGFLMAIGVDESKMLYVQLETIEDVLEAVESIIVRVRASNKDKLVAIVVDSVAGAATRSEIDGDFDKEGWNTDKAIVLSQGMRKLTNMISKQHILLVLTNQLRMKLGVTFGNKYTTSGGLGIRFHSSVRIELKRVDDIVEKNVAVGLKVRATAIKNRVGPPKRSAEFNIFFDRGIDDYSSWLEVMVECGIISRKKGAQFYEWSKSDSPKFKAKEFPKMMEDDKLRELVYSKICDLKIMKYKIPETTNSETIGADEE